MHNLLVRKNKKLTNCLIGLCLFGSFLLSFPLSLCTPSSLFDSSESCSLWSSTFSSMLSSFSTPGSLGSVYKCITMTIHIIIISITFTCSFECTSWVAIPLFVLFFHSLLCTWYSGKTSFTNIHNHIINTHEEVIWCYTYHIL